MASLSRGLRGWVGAVLLMAGPAVLLCPAALLQPDEMGSGEERRDEFAFGVAPLSSPLSYAGAGFDVGSAGYWAWAFGDLSARFDLGSQDTALLMGSPILIGAEAPRLGGAQNQGQDGLAEGMWRMARETLLDQDNTANFSVAGLEVDVNLKGGQRSILVNGYDVMLLLQTATDREEVAATRVETRYTDASPAQSAHAGDGRSNARAMLAELEAIATHPMTLFIAGALALGWLFARAWAKIQDLAARNRGPRHSHSHSRSRRR